MGLSDDIGFVRSRLNSYGEVAYRMGVASEGAGYGVPIEMYDGEVNEDGWVAWKLMPSTLHESNVSSFEMKYEISLPPLHRAYLLACFQLFDQVHSSRYDQVIFNADVPSNDPLGPLKSLIDGWKPLLSADFIPFAQWGDGWGPMCFDTANRRDDGDCPVVWMDHELLIPLGPEACRNRTEVAAHVQPLYESYRDFFCDVFEVT